MTVNVTAMTSSLNTPMAITTMKSLKNTTAMNISTQPKSSRTTSPTNYSWMKTTLEAFTNSTMEISSLAPTFTPSTFNTTVKLSTLNTSRAITTMESLTNSTPLDTSPASQSRPFHHSPNWTHNDLMQLNDAQAMKLIPAMMVIGFYIVAGLVGNLLVCYIIGYKLKMTTQNFLMVVLAVFDLLSCVISMPADIHDIRYYFYFPSEPACKIIRMLMSFNSTGSALTLIVIAADRYRKICQPLKLQLELRQAKLSVILVVTVAIIFSCPALATFGFRTIDTGVPGLRGHDCSVADTMKGTMIPMVYTSILFLVFIVACVCLITIYCCIFAATRRHSRYIRKNAFSIRLASRAKRSVDFNSSEASSSINATTTSTSMQKSHSTELVNHVGKNSLMPSPQEQSTKLCVRDADSDKKDSEMKVRSIEVNEKPSYSTTESKGQGNLAITNSHTEPSCKTELGCEPQDFVKQIPSEGYNVHLYANKSINDVSHSQISFQERGKRESSPSKRRRWSNLLRKKSNFPTPSSSNGDLDQDQKKKKGISVATKFELKATIIAFTVTIVFVLSFLPYLSLQVTKQIVEGFDYDLDGSALVFYNICLRSYYINSVANPLIYGVLNIKFRREVNTLFSNICLKSSSNSN